MKQIDEWHKVDFISGLPHFFCPFYFLIDVCLASIFGKESVGNEIINLASTCPLGEAKSMNQLFLMILTPNCCSVGQNASILKHFALYFPFLPPSNCPTSQGHISAAVSYIYAMWLCCKSYIWSFWPIPHRVRKIGQQYWILHYCQMLYIYYFNIIILVLIKKWIFRSRKTNCISIFF